MAKGLTAAKNTCVAERVQSAWCISFSGMSDAQGPLAEVMRKASSVSSTPFLFMVTAPDRGVYLSP